eukprot:3412278-Amphidinium_carterae.1
MSNDSWKPRPSTYGRGSSSSSGSYNNYPSWGSTSWHGGGKGSSSSGSSSAWRSADMYTMGYGSSSSGYYMPYGAMEWNANMYASTPMASTMPWSTAGWHTGEQGAWRPEGGTSGSRVGVPPNSEQGKRQKKTNKKFILGTYVEEDQQEETTAYEHEEITVPYVPPVPVRTFHPKSGGMRSKPYIVTKGRPYPHLEEDKVIYQSEQGDGTYPFSCVPIFSDVIEYEGFPLTPTPPSVHWKDKPVHKPKVWNEAYASKLIRQHEERRAFFEWSELPNPEVYPWDKEDANMDDLKDGTPFDIKTKCSRTRWTIGATDALRKYCYEEIKVRPEGLRYWCYACGKTPGRDTPMARCALCGNVFMCMDHRIFPDCLHNFPERPITICCRHSRFTPRPGSWNP